MICLGRNGSNLAEPFGAHEKERVPLGEWSIRKAHVSGSGGP